MPARRNTDVHLGAHVCLSVWVVVALIMLLFHGELVIGLSHLEFGLRLLHAGFCFFRTHAFEFV
jgi:hypothetical protein